MAARDRLTGVTADIPDCDGVTGYAGDARDATPLPGMPSLRSRHPRSPETGPPRDGESTGHPEEEFLPWSPQRPARETPLPMSQKRLVRRFRGQASGSVSTWQLWLATQHHTLKQTGSEITNVLSYLTMWKKSLHQIEGHFGTGIGSYFTFLRFLVLLNICTFVLVAAFVVIPVMTFERLKGEKQWITTAPPPRGGNCTEYDPTRKGLVNFYEYALDILSGTGLLELSYLFYGFYPPESVQVYGFSYNSSLAYLLTMVGFFLMTFCWTVHRAVMGFKHSRLHGDGTLSNYSNKVFTGWDFCISQPSAVQLKHKSLRYDLQMDLQDEFLRQEIASRTRWQRLAIILTRVLVNGLILLVIGAAFYAIYRATEFSQARSKVMGIAGLLIQYLPSIVITSANLVTPLIFNQLVRLEQYSPAMEIKLSLFRLVFLKLASLGVLLYSLWAQITCDGEMDSAAACRRCGYNQEQYQCWETKIGQEMYKLMIFDLLIVVSIMILIDFPRKILVQYSSWKAVQLWGEQEFLLPQNVLELVYGQTVCWVGCFFSPILPLLNTVKYILVFYLKELTLFTNCRPSNRTFRASSSRFFFLVVLLFGLLLASVPFLYSITSIHPSRACGPFRELDSIWDTVPRLVNGLPDTPRSFLNFVGSVAFLVPLFALSSVVLLFLVMRSHGYTYTITQFKKQLYQAGRDKQFLVKKMSAINISPD